MGKLERTSTPGIYRRHRKGCARKRCDCAYVVVWRHRGRQYTETHPTLAEAREAKRTRESQVVRGEFAPMSRTTLHEYAIEWIERYQGTGRRGFRDETREDYRRLLERYALRYFPRGTLLTEIDPRMIAEYIGWLTRQPNGRGGTLSDSSVRNAFTPLSACLATARREGLIRHNPAQGASLPHRPRVIEDEEQARPFPGDTMEWVIELVPARYRLMFELLAVTGLRRSELLALQGKHLALNGANPVVKVRQRLRRQPGKGLVIGPLKTYAARREVPIPVELADRLRALRKQPDELVFATENGTPLDPDNLMKRVLAPACAEAGVEWAGFHTFRHTVASRLFAEGRNVTQVQRWLGHSRPTVTLDVYVHLLDDQVGEPLALGSTPGQQNAQKQPQTAATSESGNPASASEKRPRTAASR